MDSSPSNKKGPGFFIVFLISVFVVILIFRSYVVEKPVGRYLGTATAPYGAYGGDPCPSSDPDADPCEEGEECCESEDGLMGFCIDPVEKECCPDPGDGGPITCDVDTQYCCHGSCPDLDADCCGWDSDSGLAVFCQGTYSTCCGDEGVCYDPGTQKCCDDGPTDSEGIDTKYYTCNDDKACCGGFCYDPSIGVCCKILGDDPNSAEYSWTCPLGDGCCGRDRCCFSGADCCHDRDCCLSGCEVCEEYILDLGGPGCREDCLPPANYCSKCEATETNPAGECVDECDPACEYCDSGFDTCLNGCAGNESACYCKEGACLACPLGYTCNPTLSTGHGSFSCIPPVIV